MTLLADADLRIIEVDVLLLDRWLSKSTLDTLAEWRLYLAARQIHALLDHIKAVTDEAPGYVLGAYEDACPGDAEAESVLVLASEYIHPTVESAQQMARILVRVATRPVFALVPVVT